MTTLVEVGHGKADDTETARNRLPLWAAFIAIVVPVATFGPYLAGGIRTEQAAVYGLFVMSLPFLINRLNASGGKRFLVLWTLYISLASLAVLAPSQGSPFPPGNVLAGYDNILLPLALMLLVFTSVPDAHARKVFRITLFIVAVAMTVNGLIALASTFVDLSSFLRPFWATDEVDTTVASNASEMGRFSGIFNQPAEAGFMYGAGGLAAIYVWRSRLLLLFSSLTIVSLGGFVSVSKVFIFGGLPLIIIFWFWSQRGSKRVALVLGLPVVIFAVIQSGLLLNWSGLTYFGRLFEWQDGGVLTLLSAGRAGDHSFVNEVLNAVMNFSPLVGVGAGGWKVPYDSAVAETMVVGGIFGTLAVAGILLFVVMLHRQLRDVDRVFVLLFSLLILGGSLGFSPLTANRTSTICWLIVSLAVVIKRVETAPKGEVKGSIVLRDTRSRTDSAVMHE